MRVYGNLMNRISEHVLSPTPEVGMAATVYMWSDRLPATVTAVKTSKSGKTITITLTEDAVTSWKDSYGVTFAADPDGRTHTATKRANGAWRSAGNGVSLGSRAAYRDPSF